MKNQNTTQQNNVTNNEKNVTNKALNAAQKAQLDAINAMTLQKEATLHGEKLYKADYEKLSEKQQKTFRRKLRTKFENLRFKLFVELKQKQAVSVETKKEIQTFFSENFNCATPTKFEQVSLARNENRKKDIENFLATCEAFEIFK